jgi:DNA polymerase-4
LFRVLAVIVLQRTILHIDGNNFYASIECLHRPELRDKPMVVGGDPELRHGIVLAKNMIAKKAGIITGEAIWQAKQRCPGLVSVPPNYPLYLRYAKATRAIYDEYTDRVEPFGLDEAWLDITGDDGEAVANELRRRIRNELGITASVGVSWNKIYAKLGSDMKKPDATTVITKDNYKSTVWTLPAGDLLYVGPATSRKLYDRNIMSIGDLARLDDDLLRSWFGKLGPVLAMFARGNDTSPVAHTVGDEALIKSIGNSTTTPRDLVCDEDVKIIAYVMAESVAARLREHGLRCTTVEISVRDNTLMGYTRQSKIKMATCSSSEIASEAMRIFRANHRWPRPIRSFGVRGTDLISASTPLQIDLWGDAENRAKRERLERTIDALRDRFGHHVILRAALIGDRSLGEINPKGDHVIHPVGFFKDGVMV